MADNPLFSETLFLLFDAVEAKHVVSGIRQVIADSDRELEELESTLKNVGDAVSLSPLSVPSP